MKNYMKVGCFLVFGLLLLAISCNDKDGMEVPAKGSVMILTPQEGASVTEFPLLVTLEIKDFTVKEGEQEIQYKLNNSSPVVINTTSFELDMSGVGAQSLVVYLYEVSGEVIIDADTVNFTIPEVNLGPYTVTVEGGTGSGEYEEEEVVRIESDPYDYPYEFSHWSGDNFVLTDTTSESPLFLMPSQDIFLKANLQVDPEFSIDVEVINGTGSGTYKPGDTVRISSTLEEPFTFTHWGGGKEVLADSTVVETYFVAGTEDVSLKANGEPGDVSFSEHLFPLIERECNDIGCHSVADTPAFTTYESIAASSEGIVLKTQNRNMPPPLYGSLTEEEIELIRVWVEEGSLDN